MKSFYEHLSRLVLWGGNNIVHYGIWLANSACLPWWCPVMSGTIQQRPDIRLIPPGHIHHQHACNGTKAQASKYQVSGQISFYFTLPSWHCSSFSQACNPSQSFLSFFLSFFLPSSPQASSRLSILHYNRSNRGFQGQHSHGCLFYFHSAVHDFGGWELYTAQWIIYM